MCSRSGSTCVFDASTDRRRKDALHRAEKAVDDYRDVLMTVIRILQNGEETGVQDLRKEIFQFDTIVGTIKDLQVLLATHQANCTATAKIGD